MRSRDIPLYKGPFWIRVHDVLVGFMSEDVGKSLENFIGEFLEYDSHNKHLISGECSCRFGCWWMCVCH